MEKRFSIEIKATHPMEDFDSASEEAKSMLADGLAMELVGERHGKRDLVDLVRWLLLQMDECVEEELGIFNKQRREQ